MRRVLIGVSVLLFLAVCISGDLIAAHTSGGRTLVFGRSADATYLDPAKFLDNESAMVIENLFDGLVRYADGSTRIEPALAVSWTISPDGLRYEFRLRRGVRFHDGTPFNAAAARFSLERKINPDNPFHRQQFSEMDTSLSAVKRVDVVGPYALRIVLKRPQPSLLDALARHSCYIVSPTAVSKYGDAFDRHPVGTGPFVFQAWLPGDRIILAANKRYYGGTPKIDFLVFKVIPSPRMRLLELKSGGIQAMDAPDPEFYGELRRNPSLALDARLGLSVGYLAMNTERPPLNDVLVRLAIAHAVNRRALVSLGYRDMATPAHGIVPPGVRGAVSPARGCSFDPALARRLLRRAGLRKGFSTTLWTMTASRPYMPAPLVIARLIRENLAAVGIRARIVTHDWSGHLAAVGAGEHDLCLLGWVSTGDAGDVLGHLLDSENARKPHATNVSFFRNAEVHALLARAACDRDSAERRRLFAKVQAIAADRMPILPLVFGRQVLVRRKNVSGIVNHQTGVVRFARAALQ